MIVTKIGGGLGNQMFQYAAARAISLRLNDPDIVFAAGELKTDSLRHFELDAFNLPARSPRWADELRMRMSFGNPRHPMRRIAAALLPFLRLSVFHDAEAGYDRRLSLAKGSVYLLGNWQSHLYFQDVAETIRADFQFRSPPDADNRALLERIAASQAVALHVRRGDYAQFPELTAKHGLCSLDYYQNAVSIIRRDVKDPHFFVFSDDPAWTKANLVIDAPATFVTHNTGRQNREDLRLMTACKHFVIANSTFSWWGAWLSSHVTKIVIAPQRWMAIDHGSERDLIPPDWRRIK